MKNLTLSIKQQYFDEIMAGTKKNEVREIRPNNVHKYCQVDKEGFVIENENGIVPIAYDTLTLLTGAYKGKRPKMVVKVTGVKIDLLVDDQDEFIVLKDQNDEEYYAAVVEYELGEIISAPTEKVIV